MLLVPSKLNNIGVEPLAADALPFEQPLAVPTIDSCSSLCLSAIPIRANLEAEALGSALPNFTL